MIRSLQYVALTVRTWPRARGFTMPWVSRVARKASISSIAAPDVRRISCGWCGRTQGHRVGDLGNGAGEIDTLALKNLDKANVPWLQRRRRRE